jgi:hypothetical protein
MGGTIGEAGTRLVGWEGVAGVGVVEGEAASVFSSGVAGGVG